MSKHVGNTSLRQPELRLGLLIAGIEWPKSIEFLVGFRRIQDGEKKVHKILKSGRVGLDKDRRRDYLSVKRIFVSLLSLPVKNGKCELLAKDVAPKSDGGVIR